MTNRVTLEPAYVLHSRLMSETSLLIDCLTIDHGKLSLVAKGARRPKSPLAGLLQPFNPLVISYLGASDLKTLTTAEPNGPFSFLKGERLACGLYMNELCVRLLPVQFAVPELFECYTESLHALAHEVPASPILRLFEKQLLSSLGVDLCLHQDAQLEPIDPQAHYLYDPAKGPYRVESYSAMGDLIQGQSLLDLAAGVFTSNQTCLESKRLLRSQLNLLLGERPLISRQLLKTTQK